MIDVDYSRAMQRQEDALKKYAEYMIKPETTNQSANQRQVGGDHYQSLGNHQPWDVLRSWLTPEEYRGWMKGNAIVYLAREQQKGKDQDISKACHTLQKLEEVLKN